MHTFVIKKRATPVGITLLELLVSVGIVAILAFIALPALARARAAARTAACQSNLRQWALAMQQYADVHHRQLPYRGQGIQPTTRLDGPDDWFNAIPPLMENSPYIELVRAAGQPKAGERSVWVCPEAQEIEAAKFFTNEKDYRTFFAYGMNMALSTPYMGRPDRIDRVGPTQTMVFMADGLGPHCSVLPAAADYSPVARHNGHANIAFLDGHVQSLSGEDVGCGVGDPKRDDIRWYTPNGVWPGPPR
jgi:prepilin-type processing-associated H-X9-DG protein